MALRIESCPVYCPASDLIGAGVGKHFLGGMKGGDRREFGREAAGDLLFGPTSALGWLCDHVSHMPSLFLTHIY